MILLKDWTSAKLPSGSTRVFVEKGSRMYRSRNRPSASSWWEAEAGAVGGRVVEISMLEALGPSAQNRRPDAVAAQGGP
jgi:hypothetical protein